MTSASLKVFGRRPIDVQTRRQSTDDYDPALCDDVPFGSTPAISRGYQVSLPSQPAIPQHHFLCRPHTTAKSLTYRPTLSMFSVYDKVLRRPVELAGKSGHWSTLALNASVANAP
jgi:hypothetical protein